MSRQLLFVTVILVLLVFGMSLYVWELRNVETRQPTVERVPPAVAPPGSGTNEETTVWLAQDSSGTLRTHTISVPASSGRQGRAEQVLRSLTEIYVSKNSPHPLQTGAEVKSVFLVDPGLAIINLNSAFVNGQTSGVLAEELTIASLIQTLATNVSGLTQVKILVDGKEQETLAGHADLSRFYDVASIAELAKQLQSQ
jgi:hypothetical protein